MTHTIQMFKQGDVVGEVKRMRYTLSREAAPVYTVPPGDPRDHRPGRVFGFMEMAEEIEWNEEDYYKIVSEKIVGGVRYTTVFDHVKIITSKEFILDKQPITDSQWGFLAEDYEENIKPITYNGMKRLLGGYKTLDCT